MNYNQIEQKVLARDKPPGLPEVVLRSLTAFRSGLRDSITERKTFLKLKRRRALNARNVDAIFIWVPKSAGSSLMGRLEKHSAETILTVEGMKNIRCLNGIYSFGHLNLSELVQNNLLDDSFFKRAFKFSLVRNPYDRAVSLFEYLRKIRALPPSTTFSIFCKYIEERAFETSPLKNRISLSQLNTQTSWLYDKEGLPISDYVGKLECLETSLKEIGQKLSVDLLPIPRENTSNREPIAKYYSKENIKIIRECYHDDFEHFGYDEEDIPG